MFGIKYDNTNYNKRPKKAHNFSLPSNFFNKKFLIYGGIVLFSFLVIIYYFYQENYSNYNYLKVDKSEYLVYTLESFNNGKGHACEIPYINIDSNDAKLVNEAISSFKEEFFLGQKNNILVYDSSLNGDVLSVLLRMTDYSAGYSFPDVYFHTYNFNLETRTLMSDEAILSLFSVTEEDVRNKIEEKFHEFYEDEVYKGYLVKQECDYECFLGWREVDDYLDSVSYFVRDGKLIAYRPFTVYSVYGEEEYFTDKDYEFVIAKG